MRTHRTGAADVNELAALWSDGCENDDDDEIEQLLESDSRSRFATGTGTFDLRSAERVEVNADGRAETPVSTIMARKVICARPDMDASDARRRMLERGVSGLPVVDTWGRAIGVISKTDLVEHEITSDSGRVRVRDIMTPLVFALGQNASIARAAALMAYEGVHRILIVDESGHLVGLVTSLDVARWLGNSAGLPVGRYP
jgi:CBS domain-containing protein